MSLLIFLDRNFTGAQTSPRCYFYDTEVVWWRNNNKKLEPLIRIFSLPKMKQAAVTNRTAFPPDLWAEMNMTSWSLSSLHSAVKQAIYSLTSSNFKTFNNQIANKIEYDRSISNPFNDPPVLPSTVACLYHFLPWAMALTPTSLKVFIYVNYQGGFLLSGQLDYLTPDLMAESALYTVICCFKIWSKRKLALEVHELIAVQLWAGAFLCWLMSHTWSRYCSFAATHELFPFTFRFPLQSQLSLWHYSFFISRE